MLYVNAPSELRECGAGSPQVLGHELEAHGLGAERLWERHGSTALLGEKKRKSTAPPPPLRLLPTGDGLRTPAAGPGALVEK